MNESTQKIIENTVKDILLGNAALSFLFTVPIAYIFKHGLGVGVWVITLFIAPALCGVGAWTVSRVEHHAGAFFISKWIRRSYVVYVLLFVELMLIYLIYQIIKTIIK